MAADNEIVIKALADVQAASRDLTALAQQVTVSIGKIPESKTIALEVDQAQANLKRLEGELIRLHASGARVTKIKLPVDEALANVKTLAGRVKDFGPAADQAFKVAGTAVQTWGEFLKANMAAAMQAFGSHGAAMKVLGEQWRQLQRDQGAAGKGGAEALSTLEQAFQRAGKTVADFASRTDADSKKFGQGMESAAARSKLALEALTRETQKALATGAPVKTEDIQRLDKLEAEYRQAATAAQQFRRAQGDVRSEIGLAPVPVNVLADSVVRLSTVFKAFVAQQVLSFIRDVGKESLEASEKLRAIRLQFEAVVGSAEGAADELEFVRAEAQRLGLDLPIAAAGFAKLTAGARGTKLEGAGVREVFSGIAEKATVAGLNAEEFDRVIRALSQSLSKGTLSSDELKQQLGDSLPDAVQTLARALNLSTVDLLKMMEKGLIPSTEAVAALARQYREDLGDSVEKATESATANLNRLSTAVFEAKAEFGDGFKPAVADSAQELANLVKQLAPTISLLGRLTGVLLEASTKFTIIGLLAKMAPAAKEAAAETDKLAESSFHLTTAAEKTAAKITQATAEILKYAEALPKTGSVQREEADKIVKAIDKQLTAIRELPEAEEAAFKARAAILEELRERFFQFTTAYEKEHEKQERAAEKAAAKEAKALEKRSDAIKSFIEQLGELSRAIDQASGGTLGGPNVDGSGAADLRKQIAAAEAERASLEGQSFLSPEDRERIDELDKLISDLKVNLSRLGETASEAGAAFGELGAEGVGQLDQLRQAITALLSTSDEFAAVFRSLPGEFQDAIQQLVEGFLVNLREGFITSTEDVQRFISTFISLLQQGGATTDQFAAQLQALASGTTSVATLFEQIKQQATGAAGGLAEAGAQAQSGAAPLGELGTAAAGAGSELEGSKAAAQGAGESYIYMAKAAEDSGKAASAATTEQAKLRLEVVEHKGALEQASDGYIKMGETIAEVGKKGEEAASGGILRIRGEVIKIGDAAKEASEQVEKTADGLGELGGNAEGAAEGLEKAAGAAKKVGEEAPRVKDAADAIAGLAAHSRTAATNAEGLNGAIDKSKPNLDFLVRTGKGSAAEFLKLADHLARSQKTIRELPVDVDKLAAAMNRLADAQQRVRDTDPTLAEAPAGGGG